MLAARDAATEAAGRAAEVEARGSPQQLITLNATHFSVTNTISSE